MSLINFTAKYDLFATQTDSADAGIDSDLIALVGSVTFTPIFDDNRAVLAPDYSPRPTGFKLQPIAGYLDVDGQLKTSPGGTVGVRLPANDSVFEINQLLYQVDFHVRTISGEKVQIDSGYFEAPPNDSVVQLAEVLQSTDFVGAPRLYSGEFVGNTVIFENLGGSKLTPITIPNGVLVFVDNHDSTWSVG